MSFANNFPMVNISDRLELLEKLKTKNKYKGNMNVCVI